MNWSYWIDISEGEDMFIFINNIGRELFMDKFVENGLFCHSRYVYRYIDL